MKDIGDFTTTTITSPYHLASRTHGRTIVALGKHVPIVDIRNHWLFKNMADDARRMITCTNISNWINNEKAFCSSTLIANMDVPILLNVFYGTYWNLCAHMALFVGIA